MDTELDIKIKNYLCSEENYKVPEKISSGVDKTLKKIGIKQKRKRLIKIFSAAAAMFLIISIGLGIAFPTFAMQIPILNRILGRQSLFSKMTPYNNEFEKIKNIQNNSVAVNKTSTNNGISIKLKEIAYDGAALYVIYQIKGNINTDKIRILDTITVDGKSYDFTNENAIECKALNNNTIEIAQMYTISDGYKLPNKFNVSIDFTEVNWRKGNWKFNMSIDKNLLSKGSKHSVINKDVQLNTLKGTICSLTETSMFSTLTVEYYNYNRNNSDETYRAFSLIDKDGTELQQTEEKNIIKDGDKTKIIAVYKSNNVPVKKILVYQPAFGSWQAQKIKNKTYVEYSAALPKTVSIGSGKEITINKIETEKEIKNSHIISNVDNYYVLTITAKDLSIEGYIWGGGITSYCRNMNSSNYNAYGSAQVSVIGKNTYKLRFYEDTAKVASQNYVLAFAQYDEALHKIDEINIAN